ncbi:MAG TPA: GNAT family N-acetyltransferase, partial [Glaciibacter sp.]|nr:GNAT family N-acetyltransferase [Glaciibacter sp.]
MTDTTTPAGLTTLPYTVHPVRTERLLLRPLTEADVDDVHAYQSIAEVVRHLPWPLRNLEESREHTVKRAGFSRLENDDDAIVLAAELAVADGERGRVIGDFSIMLSSAQHAQVEVGWVLHPAFQGKGYATEAAAAVIDMVFTEIGAHRVHADLDPAN